MSRSDIEIAQAQTLEPIDEIAGELGLGTDDLERYGNHQAKVKMATAARLLASDRAEAPLVLVSSMTATAAGAGKTTCSVGLAQALRQIGHRSCVTLREPSMGPVFGRKGGAAGGGYAQVLPMESINLHFTGDMHAITAANNLMAAVLGNAIQGENPDRIDPGQVRWRRCLDMNDRALRRIVTELAPQVQVRTGFDITAASTIMAALCLSLGYDELKAKIASTLLAVSEEGTPVTAGDLGVEGAATALLKQALQPNLVQTLEHGPAFVHGGPFANIAQGTCSAISMRLARKLADVVVTEAGFGFDLGGEKFLDLVGPYAGLAPSVVVLVATVRSLKMHGGAKAEDVEAPDAAAVTAGGPNLEKHVENVRKFGLEPIVAINRFRTDSAEEIAATEAICEAAGARAEVVDYREQGGAGGTGLAEAVMAAAARFEAGGGAVRRLYDWAQAPEEKIETIAREIYGAEGVDYAPEAREELAWIKAHGGGELPICMAKTPLSLSDKADRVGRPEGFTIDVRQVLLSRGGGFLIPMTGPILRMPGLPRRPAALDIDIDEAGRITGLF